MLESHPRGVDRQSCTGLIYIYCVELGIHSVFIYTLGLALMLALTLVLHDKTPLSTGLGFCRQKPVSAGHEV